MAVIKYRDPKTKEWVTVGAASDSYAERDLSNVSDEDMLAKIEACGFAEEVNELKTSVSEGKSLIAAAVTDKGVPTAADATFDTIKNNIENITTVSQGTADATATSADMLEGVTAYVGGEKVTGIIPTLAAQTITPGTINKTVTAGQYLGGDQTIKGDSNLVAGNIKSGVSIFGVMGSLASASVVTGTVTNGSTQTNTITFPNAKGKNNIVVTPSGNSYGLCTYIYLNGTSYYGYPNSSGVIINSTNHTITYTPSTGVLKASSNIIHSNTLFYVAW